MTVEQKNTQTFQSWLRLKLAQGTWFVFGIIEALLGLRFALKIIAANPENPFASTIYAITAPFMFPFRDLTVTPSAGGIVLELNTLIAMAVYALIAWAAFNVLALIFTRPRKPVETEVVATTHHVEERYNTPTSR
jgi:YggT family protein